jgi:SH3-like domain-containing protein
MRAYPGVRSRLWAHFRKAFLGPSVLPVFALLAFFLCARPALAEELPRFASLQSSEVNMRIGPGEDYPILWIYRRAGLPVEIIEEFDLWRRVRDHDGVVGWVRANLLSGKRNVLVRDRRRALLAGPEDGASEIALVDPGVILALLECEKIWCRVEIRDLTGWLRKDAFWGVYADEIIGD